MQDTEREPREVQRPMTTGTVSTSTRQPGRETRRVANSAEGRARTLGARSRSNESDSLGLFLRDLDHHPLPDHDAQTELAKRVAAGDDAARRETTT